MSYFSFANFIKELEENCNVYLMSEQPLKSFKN